MDMESGMGTDREASSVESENEVSQEGEPDRGACNPRRRKARGLGAFAASAYAPL